MDLTKFTVIEAAILASSLSIDAFTAGFAYGSNKIKIPMVSIQIINLICGFITGISIFAGTFLKPYVPQRLAITIAFTILFLTGSVKLLDSITKSVIRKHKNFKKGFKFSLLNIKFILNIYADPEDADVDVSKDISPAEAAALAISLSLDGIAVGFGAALANTNGRAVILFSLISNSAAIIIGHFIGNKIARKLKYNISWLSGIVLIGLAFSKFL